MYDVRTNFFENRLQVLFKGKLDLTEAKAASQKILLNARRLQPGFIKVTDIRELSPASEEVRLELQRTMKALAELGMGPVIRITSPNAVITANQFQRTSRSVGYTAVEVASMLEAERVFDEL